MKYLCWANKPLIRANAMGELGNLDPEKDYDVIIKPHETSKTVEQRGWFHKLCQLLGNEIGVPEGDIKEIAKAQLFGWRTVCIGGITLTIADGHSEKLKLMQYSELIEIVYRLGAEAGVILPPPDKFRKPA